MALRSYQINSILAVRFSAIGDIILALPVVEALHACFPGAAIDFALKREFQGLAAHHPLVRRVHALDPALGFAGLKALNDRINESAYDLVVDLHQNLRSNYLRLFSNARLKRVYRKWSLERLLLTRFGINRLNGAPRVLDRYFTALEDFGIQREGRRPRLYFEPGLKEKVRDFLSGRGLPPGRKYLVAAPGASFPTKRWPGSRFVEAASALARGGLAIVMLGGGQDRELGRELTRELGERKLSALDLCGELAIEESALVIEGAELVLSNDSGLMHVADALDRPLVAVFGPTSRELGFYPPGPRSRVVEVEGLKCRPCTLHGNQACPRRHHHCMEEVPVEKVVAAAREVMAGP